MEAEMSPTDKYRNGTITITDLEPGINTAGKARGAGYVLHDLRTITEQIHTLKGMYGGDEQTLEAYGGDKNYVRRLYRTRKAINEHFNPQPEHNVAGNHT